MSTGARLQQDVRTLLNEHGYDVTFRRTPESSYDPETGQTTTGTDDDETVRAVFLNYRESEIQDSDIQRGDRKAVISAITAAGAALSKTPQTGDKLVGEDDTVAVVSARKIKSGSSTIAYICQVRE